MAGTKVRKVYPIAYLAGVIVCVGLSACAGSVQDPPPATVTTTAERRDPAASPPSTPGQGTTIQQWGSDAEASSEYGNPEWSAAQAAGPPNAPGCGDYQFAWASAASDAVATLTVKYSIPVFPREIQIVESFHPDQVVKVEVGTPEGAFQTVYQSEPRQVDRPCPYTLSIEVDQVMVKVDKVRLTVDQSVLGLGWNEIDAVQLSGRLEGDSGG